MKQTRTGNRVVIGRTPSAAEKVTRREPTGRRTKARRIVVIKDGELVGSQPRR
jgi:hypothetical protein